MELTNHIDMDSAILEYKRIGHDTVYHITRNDFKAMFPPSESIKKLDLTKLAEALTYRSIEPNFIHILRSKDYSCELVSEYLLRGGDPQYPYIEKVINESFQHLINKKHKLLPASWTSSNYLLFGFVATGVAAAAYYLYKY
jgi:hypothetical protein